MFYFITKSVLALMYKFNQPYSVHDAKYVLPEGNYVQNKQNKFTSTQLSIFWC